MDKPSNNRMQDPSTQHSAGGSFGLENPWSGISSLSREATVAIRIDQAGHKAPALGCAFLLLSSFVLFLGGLSVRLYGLERGEGGALRNGCSEIEGLNGPSERELPARFETWVVGDP